MEEAAIKGHPRAQSLIQSGGIEWNDGDGSSERDMSKLKRAAEQQGISLSLLILDVMKQ